MLPLIMTRKYVSYRREWMERHINEILLGLIQSDKENQKMFLSIRLAVLSNHSPLSKLTESTLAIL